jgi:hypothetical protein
MAKAARVALEGKQQVSPKALWKERYKERPAVQSPSRQAVITAQDSDRESQGSST